ncbi:peptidase C69 [Porphyromonas crevioricanis]|uniref:Dipeptidase n=2 Tax=Porphyromonas crevioricanis TaxID=393921 RepID=A0A0A2FQ05_9PORP|nr:C69 family dipeptidase [Porphyromonas crevioricanis]KGN90319.1 peptidase C69 [Porphyromonas crevioricanis]KGN95341.1 peptidase C69 [Porphyromonas crevioricanis]SJZ59769.1 Dipeptidase [Porphyromonas crevioricanis]SQH72758.1 Dipeptidase A [Porphyromonas crevioricanis]GAD05624.1 probable dipeptidase [Porphyromonas crevioricanis JCM 15906]
MKVKLLFAALAVALTAGLRMPEASACTNLIVGKKASKDGSVMVSYSADSHVLYGELYHYPAGKHAKGTMRKIVEWDTYKYLGEIPEAPETYNVIGNMNEHQVLIGESTWGGRKELHEPNGIMDYGSLIYVALQRSKTAREAIKVMTDLVEKYGYHSSGESFSIADKNEVWVLELIGKGKHEKGAVWVAIRIPDDAISGHANQARIQQIPFKDKANCMYSKDVVSFARKMGYFSGKDKDFSFQAAYNPYDATGLRGCEGRVFAFFNKFSKDAKQYENFILGKSDTPMPLYIKPDRKLSVGDVRDMMRDHYEGTCLDMTKDVGAGPYHVPYRWRPMTFVVDGKEYVNERAIATQQTGWVFVGQLRSELPDPIGGVLWFGTDDADMAVFTPIYCSVTEVPECYRQGNGDMLTFSWTSSFWIHNWVANMAYHKYSFMIEDIRKVQRELEGSYDAQLVPMADKKALELFGQDPAQATTFLNQFCALNSNAATARWKQLGEYLLVKYIDGNVKKEKDGKFLRDENGNTPMPNQPGYDEKYYRNIVEDTGDHLLIGPAN